MPWGGGALRRKGRYEASRFIIAVGVATSPHADAGHVQETGLDVSRVRVASGARRTIVPIPFTTERRFDALQALVDFGYPSGGYRSKAGRANTAAAMGVASGHEFSAGSSQRSLDVFRISDYRQYAGIVFFQTRPVRRGGSTLAFSARVASKIYETIPDTVKIEGVVAKMASAKSANGQNYRIVFNNTANAHVYLRGQVQVQKGGSVVDRVSMPEEMLVERGGTRTIEVSGKRLAPGTYQAIATIDYGGKTQTGGAIEFTVP